MPEGPPWRIVLAAIFGGLVLVGFFYVAVQTGPTGVAYVCNAYLPLLVVFALGTALAGAFIGGEIGVRIDSDAGTFGRIGLAALGGIASMVAVSVGGYYAHPRFCPGEDSARLLQIHELPVSAMVSALPYDFFVRTPDPRTILVRLNGAPKKPTSSLLVISFPGSDVPACSIRIQELGESASDALAKEWEALPIAVYFDDEYISKSSGARLNAASCLRSAVGSAGEPLHPTMYSDGTHLRMWPVKPLAGGNPESPCLPGAVCSEASHLLDGGGSRLDTPLGTDDHSRFLGLVGAATAYAQDLAALSIDEVLQQLARPNDADVAKGTLLDNIDSVAKDIYLRLVDNQSTNTPKAEILDVFIEAINRQQPSLVPGNGLRDLSQEIELFKALGINGGQNPYHQIVLLSAADDPGIRLNARRLLQRFPVDKFETEYQEYRDGLLFREGCNDTPSDTYVRYGALRYYYNRMIEYYYSKLEISVEQNVQITHSFELGKSVSICLPDDLRVDSALLEYARALIALNSSYQRLGGRGTIDDDAVDAAREFVETVKASGGNYIFPAHLLYMSAFRTGATWDQITTYSGFLKGVTVGGSAGLSDGPELLSGAIGDKPLSIFDLSPSFAGQLAAQETETSVSAEQIISVLATASGSAFVAHSAGGTGETIDFGWIRTD